MGMLESTKEQLKNNRPPMETMRARMLVAAGIACAALAGYFFGQLEKSCDGEVIRALRFYGIPASVQLDKPLPD